MKTQTCSKINLGLNIVARRPDGYHDLQTVFYPVGLGDEIEITENGGRGCQLTVGGMPIDGDPAKNLVVRAWQLLDARFRLPGVTIRLDKGVPMQAGMGGGSADAAYTLLMLNKMFALGLSVAQLQNLSASLGADCPFFIESRPAYAEGIGERLTPVDLDLGTLWLAIVKPPVAVSTREAFSRVVPRQPLKNCRQVVAQPVETWKDELYNDFEDSIFPQYPVIGEVKNELYDMGALYAAMSGSGSAVFGLFPHRVAGLAERFTNAFTTVLPALSRPSSLITP